MTNAKITRLSKDCVEVRPVMTTLEGEVILMDPIVINELTTKQPLAEPRKMVVKDTPTKQGFNSDYIQFESSALRATEQQRFRIKSKKKFRKVKTPLAAIAKGHCEYRNGYVDTIVSDVALFNMLTERLVNTGQQREGGEYYQEHKYTECVLPVKVVERFKTIAPAIPASTMQTVSAFLTALLAFKGKTLEVVSRELKLLRQRGEKSITYNVNTAVRCGEVSFKVGKVTVKKTFADGIFFDTHTCRKVRNLVTAAMLTKDGQANAIE